MSRVNQILACLVSLAMVFLVLEGGLRLLGFGPRPTMNDFDPTLGWSKTPSTSIRRQTSEFDVTLQTNARGLREDESLDYPKPANIRRVLIVGDSFTLGYTVPRDETISRLLEARLAQEGRAVQVINGGTEGYSTDQEVLWLAREGRKYSPDVVVLQMYENDIFWNSQDRYLRYSKPHLSADMTADRLLAAPATLPDPGKEPWVKRSTALGSLLAGIVAPPDLPRLADHGGLPAEWEVRLRDGAAGWRETEIALRAFRAIAEQIGAKPLVLVIPDKAQIDPAARQAAAAAIGDASYDPDRPYQGMIRAAIAAGLPVVDPRSALLEEFRSDGLPLYFGKDWHTNAAGNELLAEELATALARPELLGEPARHVAPVRPSAESAPKASRLPLVLTILGVWLVLGTAYRRRFPAEGAVKSYGSVAGLISLVILLFVGIDWLASILPLSLARWLPRIVGLAVLGAVIWYLRRRLPVMGELFATFVRRGQWYMLPVLVGLLSIGALLVVAASSPWLAPFIYTLF